jgi:HD-GYP domain-containing protein (c-di-GMP phosphodiesterase class II)
MDPTGMLVVSSAVAGLAAGLAYGAINVVAVAIGVAALYGRHATLPWSHFRPVVASQVVQATLGAVLGVLISRSSSISLILLVLTVFLIGHSVFGSHALLRATHESMLKGFVKILETRDLYTRGHTERVVDFALAIGHELRMSSTQLGDIRLAALIHDVGKLAVPAEIMRKQGALSEIEYQLMRRATHRVDDLLAEVDFLDPLVSIYSGCHPRWHGQDFGQRNHSHSTDPTREQQVLAVADAFDAMTSTRAYRMALPQSLALERLVASDDPLFDRRVVNALRSALDKRGGSYGPPLAAMPEQQEANTGV